MPQGKPRGRPHRFESGQPVAITRGRQRGVVAGVPADGGLYPVAVFRDKEPRLRWVPASELREADMREKDEQLLSFVRSPRGRAAASAPPPSATRVSPQDLSRNEPAGRLPGWSGDRARLLTGRTEQEAASKKLSKNARRKMRRYDSG